jgi:hypothetical protein
MSEEEWRSVIAVHLYGCSFVSRARPPFFRGQQSGSFVHMTFHDPPDRQFRQANYSRQDRSWRARKQHRSISARYKRAIQLHCSVCLEPHDDSIPANTPQEKERCRSCRKMGSPQSSPPRRVVSRRPALDHRQIFAVRAMRSC